MSLRLPFLGGAGPRPMTVLVMSGKEIDRLEILRELAERRLTVTEAAEQLRLCRRQVLRLAKNYGGKDRWRWDLASAGSPSNRGYPAAVREETVVSRSRGGRPRVALEIRQLIQQISLANPLWGAPRIHDGLLKLGIDIGQISAAKCMAKRRKPPSQGWKTVLRNHAEGLRRWTFSWFRHCPSSCCMAC